MSTRAQSLVPHARSRVAPSVFAKSTLRVAHGVACSTRSTLAFVRVVVRRRARACARAHVVVVVVVRANMIGRARTSAAKCRRFIRDATRAARRGARISRIQSPSNAMCERKRTRAPGIKKWARRREIPSSIAPASSRARRRPARAPRRLSPPQQSAKHGCRATRTRFPEATRGERRVRATTSAALGREGRARARRMRRAKRSRVRTTDE